MIKLTGKTYIEPNLPDDFVHMTLGDIVIKRGWPHVVVDAGLEQGLRIAGFREPYSIAEVYYDKDDKIEMMTIQPVYPYGETLEQLKEDIEKMRAACELAVVEEMGGK